MFYKKVTSRDHKWFFLLRYGDLKEGLEMWSSRSLKWQYFDYQQSRSLQAILNDTDLCNDIMPEEAADIIKNILIRSKDRFPALFYLAIYKSSCRSRSVAIIDNIL